MSFSIQMSVGNPSNTTSEYRVQRRAGCTLVFGSLPVDDFVALTKKQPKKTMMSNHLAHLAGCDIAFGTDECIDSLTKELEPEALARGQARYATTGLSPDAILWLSIGNRGKSSNAMFFMLTGVNPGDIDPRSVSAHPHDTGDLYRCRLLLEAVPETGPVFDRMSDVSPEWAEFVEQWSALCDQMDVETPNWRDGRSQSPLTSRMIKTISETAQSRTVSYSAYSDCAPG